MPKTADRELVLTDEARLHVMTPREIVSELDRYIIGQQKAKRAVAIAERFDDHLIDQLLSICSQHHFFFLAGIFGDG